MEIYKITNLINNKSYVGKTKKCFHKRYNHRYDWWNAPSVNVALQHAVNKYGSDNFKVEILFKSEDYNLKLLDQLEIHFIQLNNTMSPYGYNFTSGGDGGFKICVESIEKLKKSLVGKTGVGKNIKGHKKTKEQVEKQVKTMTEKFASGELQPWNKGLETGRPSEEAVLNSAKAHMKKVIRINPKNNEEKIYDGAILAKQDGFDPAQISLCCKHPEKHKSHKNYYWKYA